MLENEVAPVIKSLVENGIEVVAIHNHMVHDSQESFFTLLGHWECRAIGKGIESCFK
jgi:hypothetical protein